MSWTSPVAFLEAFLRKNDSVIIWCLLSWGFSQMIIWKYHILDFNPKVHALYWLKYFDISIVWVHLLPLLPPLIYSQPISSINDKLYSKSGKLSPCSYFPLFWSCLQLQICFLYSRNMSLTSPWIAFQVPAASSPSTGHTCLLLLVVLPLLLAFISLLSLVCHTSPSDCQIMTFVTSVRRNPYQIIV